MQARIASASRRDGNETGALAHLVIVPPVGASPVSPSAGLLGMPLLSRTVWTAHRAGFAQILVLAPDPLETKRLLGAAPASVLSPGESITLPVGGRLVFLAANVLVDPQWLRALIEMPLKPQEFYRNGDAVAVMNANDALPVLSGISTNIQAPALFAALGQFSKTVDREIVREGSLVLATPDDIKKAEDWLLRGLIKDTESFMSQHVERPISLAITRRLVLTSITPNTMTAVSVGIGLLGAPFFLSPNAAFQLTGSLLFLSHSILDGCDGELARLKFMESRWGGLLDFWGDNVVHVAIFLCMAAGWGLATQSPWPWLAGASATMATLGIASVIYWHTLRANRSSGPLFVSIWRRSSSGIDHFMDRLARRDFIYAIVLLSAFGKAAWFLSLVAVGGPIFFLLLVLKMRFAIL